MTYKRDLARIEWIIEQARTAAWGSKMQTLEGKRKVRRGVMVFIRHLHLITG